MNYILLVAHPILIPLFRPSINLCSGGENELLDDEMNEHEYTMCFIYPLFSNLLKYSKEDMVIRW